MDSRRKQKLRELVVDIQHKLRVSNSLLEQLKKAVEFYSDTYLISYSDICQKALRSHARLKPDLSLIKPESTYKGTCLALCFPDIVWEDKKMNEKQKADLLRRALIWYLGRLEYKEVKKTPLKIDTSSDHVFSETEVDF